MIALKKARKLVEKDPSSPTAETLSSLVVALASETPFAIHALYKLDYEEFQLALEVLNEWRLDRYYTSKGRLLDLSVQLRELRDPDAPGTA